MHYREGRVVTTGSQDDCPEFAEIKTVVVDARSNIFLVVEQLNTVRFVHHIRSFVVEHTSSPSIFAVALDSLIDPHCMSYRTHSHTHCQYITTKYNVVY